MQKTQEQGQQQKKKKRDGVSGSLMYHAHEPWWWRRTPASFVLDAFLMLAQEWRSFALRICSSQQRTLACCPPPAQVFSQQLFYQFYFIFAKLARGKN